MMIQKINGSFISQVKQESFKQKALNWLFPINEDSEPLKNETISNKRFIFMVTVGISLIVIMEIIN